MHWCNWYARSGAIAITLFGDTLHAALTLALSGSVTSVSLSVAHPVSSKVARKRLNVYAVRGYLARVGEPRCGAFGTTVYVITDAGRARLARLNAERACITPTGATGLNFGPLMAALHDGGR